MKQILTIILTFTTILAFGQFPEKHLELLSKMNCGLTDVWSITTEPDSSFADDFPNIPAITINLISYKTVIKKANGNGINMGIEIDLIDKKYAKKIRAYDWSDEGVDEFLLLETKSYIVVITYDKDFNDIYAKMTTKLIPELEKYFQDNKDLL